MATLVTPVWHLLQAYYLKAHSGRKLTWQTNMGSADLKAVFGSKRHELNVSTYQVHSRGMHCTSVYPARIVSVD
jgi:Cullin family